MGDGPAARARDRASTRPAWTSVDALGAAAEDYGRLVVFVAGWAVLATMVGVLARSVPIGVGVGLVWAGPVENVIADGWTPGQQFFPGLVLRAIISPDAAAISTAGRSSRWPPTRAVAVTVTGIARLAAAT